jgi:hypothetical protein
MSKVVENNIPEYFIWKNSSGLIEKKRMKE